MSLVVRFSFGGSLGFCSDGAAVPSGAVESSGAGCLRFKVGRPGVPSLLSLLPRFEVETLAFDNLRRRALTL